MRVLVTGVDGFVGGHLLESLRGRGHHVTGTVFRRAPQSGELAIDIGRDDGLGALAGESFDAVIHNAGVVDQSLPARVMRQVNAEGTRRVAAWARQAGVKHLVQISSIAVYGMKCCGEERTEALPRVRGLGIPYMRSKAAAERYVESCGVPYTILRLPSVFGPGDTVTTPSIVSQLRSGGVPGPLFRRERRFSTLYVANLGPIVDRVLARGPLGQAFNCAGHHTTWGAFVAEYAAQLSLPLRWKRRPLISIAGRLRDTGYQFAFMNAAFGAHFPTERLERALAGPLPRHDWREGVRAAVRAHPR
ncbi:MAG: NAD-dependent epimerase/dehydratase family protein [Planctomycetota bacterium]